MPADRARRDGLDQQPLSAEEERCMRECLRNWSDAGHTDCNGGWVPFERHGCNRVGVRISTVRGSGNGCAEEWRAQVVAGPIVVPRLRIRVGRIDRLAAGDLKGRRLVETRGHRMRLARVGNRSQPERQPPENQPYRAPRSSHLARRSRIPGIDCHVGHMNNPGRLRHGIGTYPTRRLRAAC